MTLPDKRASPLSCVYFGYSCLRIHACPKVICITLVMGIAESNDKKVLAVFGGSSGLLIACNLYAALAKVTRGAMSLYFDAET